MSQSLKIALIQQHAGPDPEENLERGVEAFRQAASQDADVIMFAELAFQRFFPQHRRDPLQRVNSENIPGPTTERFSHLSKELGVVTILNIYEQDGDRKFDSSPVIDADGVLLGVTRMVHIMQGPCFYERDYYNPGDRGAQVFDTKVGKVGVAICYDRHYPEYMRALALQGAGLVVVPQAGAIDEWPPGLFEAELQVASMQNGYFCALVNRVGEETCLTFAGESFVTDPKGQIVARAPRGEDCILYAELDLELLTDCPAKRHFLPDRRPDLYPLSAD